MKDQYFADVNDYRKYGLLRALTLPDRLRLGVCWMLTESDGRTDGQFLAYLSNPADFRRHDPDLFDFLNAAVNENKRCVHRITGSSTLRNAVFHPDLLTDRAADRAAYFAAAAPLLSDCDLVFFDPDNGIATPSIRKGNKNSAKYLYWDEVSTTFAAGSSVLIYQHFIREERSRFADRLVRDLRTATGAPATFSFGTPHVLFLLASHDRHAPSFRRTLDPIRVSWGTHISPREH